ncbi:hypothetical protein [Pleomorphovibrio marinus]|uniref:hypothetical protein n=1 Tax=Pleomorphovibrio marinus TaxID=2164132 RepID=UPI0013005EC8|nr:hypothetical protein [Pleomorphovibrio marinus]
MAKWAITIISISMLFFHSCGDKESLHDTLAIPKDKYNEILLIIDSGCSSCKNKFYEFVEREWPKDKALIIRGRISQGTKYNYEKMLMEEFVILDPEDRAYSSGIIGKNTELALLKNNKLHIYTYLEFKELIEELKKP